MLSTKCNFGRYSEFFLPKAVFHLFLSKKRNKAHKSGNSMFLTGSFGSCIPATPVLWVITVPNAFRMFHLYKNTECHANTHNMKYSWHYVTKVVKNSISNAYMLEACYKFFHHDNQSDLLLNVSLLSSYIPYFPYILSLPCAPLPCIQNY